MTGFKALLIFLLFLHLSAAEAQESLSDVRAKLSSIQSYQAKIIAKTQFAPSAPLATMESEVWGRTPNLFRLEAHLTSDQGSLSSVMVFDGKWQWVETKQARGHRQQRKIVKVNGALARPEKPFDTFLYFTGSGLFAGEDYIGTITEILNLYEFGPAISKNDGTVFEGTLNEKAMEAYLESRGQLGMINLLSATPMGKCRLIIGPSSLPLAYTLGDDLEEPFMEVHYQELDINSPIAADRFKYLPPAGWAVFDMTAETAESRLRSSQIKPGSDLFEMVRSFVEKEDVLEMPEALDNALEDGRVEDALRIVRADPSLLKSEDTLGNQPLHLALQNDQHELALQLLEMGADPFEPGYGDSTPLHAAAQSGNTPAVKKLLLMGADREARNLRGDTPLHLAQDPETIEILLQAGAVEEVFNNSGELPYVVREKAAIFLHAVWEEDSDGIQRGLKAGIPLTARVNTNRLPTFSPLEMASARGVSVLKELWPTFASKASSQEAKEMASTLLFTAGNAEVVDYLISLGAEPNATVEGLTPLFMHLPLESKTALVKAGADINFQTSRGHTALTKALTQNVGHIDLELADQLVKLGADPSQTFLLDEDEDLEGRANLLHWAILNEQESLVRWALEQGVAADGKAEQGWSPVNLAAGTGRLKVVQMLKEHGAALDEAEENGWTPLHSATYLGYIEVVEYLLQEGVNPNLKDGAGNTALHLASHLGKLKLAQLLLKNGADEKASNKDGDKPRDLAPEANKSLRELLK